MPMTDKKRKTDAAWKKRNLATIACKLYKNDAEKFRQYAAQQGKSVQSLLQGYVAQCIGPLEYHPGPGGEKSGDNSSNSEDN
ncbi:MAG: hypothetical protein LUD79_05045 [Oscillospiraceae bacterium]|nr:hypothetical protein [Oscillospiraceae bacterium]